MKRGNKNGVDVFLNDEVERIISSGVANGRLDAVTAVAREAVEDFVTVYLPEQTWSAFRQLLDETKNDVLRLAQKAAKGCDSMETYLNKQTAIGPFTVSKVDPFSWSSWIVQGEALTEFWKAKEQQAGCPVHARCKEECNTDSYKSDGTPFADAIAMFQCIKKCKDCATKLQNLAQYIPRAGHELYEDFRAADDVQSFDEIMGDAKKKTKYEQDLDLLRRCHGTVDQKSALHGECSPISLYGVSNEARIKFGADLYSEAFKKGLEGEVVTSDPDSPAKKELPYEACGMFGDINLGGCDQAVTECDANPNPNGCKPSVGKWWDQQIAELEALHKAQLPGVAQAIAEAACGEEFAVSVTLTAADAAALVADTEKLSRVKAALGLPDDTPELQEAVATPKMLTLSAKFNDRAAACAAYPVWKAALAKSLHALAAYEITEAFVSKHMRKTP